MTNPTYSQRSAQTREVAPGLHAIKSLYAANKPLWVYVLDGAYTLWADTGINVTPDEVVIPYLTDRAPGALEKPQVAIITHADVDHFGGLRRLKARRPDTLVLAHAGDRAWIESPDAVLRERYRMHAGDGIDLPQERRDILNERGGGGGRIDIALCGGEVLHLGDAGNWTVLHAPGHSRGHLVLWEQERKWAIIGDAALDWGVPDVDGQMLAPPPYYDLAAYVRTVGMLRGLQAETVFTSHYGILDRAQAEQLYDNSIAATTALDAAVTVSLRERPGGITLAELCSLAGARCPQWPESLRPGLADPISAHLQAAQARGSVERVLTGSRPLYRAV